MIWLILLIILAPLCYVAGFILDRGAFPAVKGKWGPEDWGNFLRGVSYLLFAVILVILLFGAGAELLSEKKPISEVQARELALILPVSEATYVPIRDFNVADPIIEARAAIVTDARSGRILFAQNADKRLPIASITKLMTALVVLERLDLEATYSVSAEDLNLDGLGADFAKGEQLSGHDLLATMLIKSSNDAASVFASTAQGLGIDLVALMNQKAQQLGMLDTKFNDPAGLDDGSTYSTAQDLVKLLTATRKNTDITQTLTRTSADIAGRHLENTNKLLGKIPGIVIGKTGNTTGALGTMALMSGAGNGEEIIVIVLGSKDRFGDAEMLVKWTEKAYTW